MPNDHASAVRGVFRGAAVLVVARVLTMALGLVQTVLVARWFGATTAADVFFVASAVPFLFLGVVESNLGFAFTPMFVGLEQAGKTDDAWVMAATLFKKGALFVGLYMVGTVVLAGPLAAVLAPGFTPEAKRELVLMIRCISPLSLLMFVSAVLTSLCFVRGAFLLPGATYLLGSATPLVALCLLRDRLGIYALPLGLVLGSALGIAILFPKFGIRHPMFRTRSNLRHPVVREFGRAMALRTAATSLVQVNVAVDGAFASGLAQGHVAYLAYAGRMLTAVRRVLVVPLGRSLMPALSRVAARDDLAGVRRILAGATGILAFFIIPVFVFLMAFSHDVIRLVFASGKFSEEAVHHTAIALMFYAVGAFSAVLNPVLTAAHFALRDSLSPLKVAVAGVFLNALFNFICLRIFQSSAGIALSTSLVAAAASFMLWRSLGRVSGGIPVRIVAVSLGRAFLGALVLVVVARRVHEYFSFLDSHSRLLGILVSFLAGGLAYLGVQLLFGREQLRVVFARLRRRG